MPRGLRESAHRLIRRSKFYISLILLAGGFYFLMRGFGDYDWSLNKAGIVLGDKPFSGPMSNLFLTWQDYYITCTLYAMIIGSILLMLGFFEYSKGKLKQLPFTVIGGLLLIYIALDAFDQIPRIFPPANPAILIHLYPLWLESQNGAIPFNQAIWYCKQQALVGVVLLVGGAWLLAEATKHKRRSTNLQKHS